ncbi:MAG: CBS domain-containing protein [Pseudomonadota bacterium]
MFVSMWMTRQLETVTPSATLAEIATRMARLKIRRLPVVNSSAEGLRLLGIVTHSNVLHAFPASINPFAVNAADGVAAIEAAAGGSRVTATDLMARDPYVTAPDAPIESAARLMRDHKIGALPVVSQHLLVGIITESDIFRAMVEVFEAPDRAIRITFSLSAGEDVLPLVADIARRRDMRVTSFMALPRHDPPVCVVQLAGNNVEAALEDVWKSRHRVMNVVHLATEPTAS